MNKHLILVLLMAASVFYTSCTPASDNRFKNYRDPKAGFSFDIPTDWTISYNTELNAYTCASTDSAIAKRYADCYEGNIFMLEVHDKPLDSVLLTGDIYRKVDTNYITTDRISDSVVAQPISGKGWRGIHHVNVCGITCKSTGFQSATGSCEFFYFSDTNRTVSIVTSGRAIDPEVKKVMLSSFAFAGE
jgi:hypothetical protein